MNKYTRKTLALFLIFACILTISPKVYAAKKTNDSRTIAIVFDNSGSMYDSGDQAWCRATYAMEVFASMLNTGDTLMIYPMHPIVVANKEYTMKDPFCVTDASQASTIREIYTEKAGGTPIESVDHAIEGLQKSSADKKYMIVLTDGEAFYRNGSEMSISETKRQLDTRFQKQAGTEMTVMYLGIGNKVVMPDTNESEYFVKKQAKNSEDVLAALTDMCNRIFGRDTLPKTHIVGNNIDFDISMSKLIVFVQGENVSNVKLSGETGTIGQQIGTASTKYGTDGCGNYKAMSDTSLQGMMVTYSDCAAGNYTIEYSGNASSIEVYYEPDADLDFVFTDAEGKDVDYNALYEGTYKVSFGMKDAKTGKLIASELLGNPHYQGSYSINGEKFSIIHDGHSGEVPINLKMNDTFEAELMVTYLSGYTISKDSSDFGWPDGGIQIAARPAGDLVLEITGGDELYSLQDLDEGAPYTAKVYYQGELLTGKELEAVDLKWDPDTSNAEITEQFADDHYDLFLRYKDPSAPENTQCGACTVSIFAFYTAQGSDEAQTEDTLTYNINDDFSPLQMELHAEEDYIVISELADGKEIVVNLKIDGQKLTAEDFDAVELQVDCGGIQHTLTADKQNSAYVICLTSTEGIAEGDYPIKVTAQYTDHIGRTTEVDEEIEVTLSNMPLWKRWALGIALALLLLALILIILHIHRLPKHTHAVKRECSMIVDDEDVMKNTAFDAGVEGKKMNVSSKYAGVKAGLTMDVKAGADSYLRKTQVRRSIEVASASLKKQGGAKIDEVYLGSVKYSLNEDTGKLERTPKSDKPFTLRHGTTIRYSGTMNAAGSTKPFNASVKLNFKKK